MAVTPGWDVEDLNLLEDAVAEEIQRHIALMLASGHWNCLRSDAEIRQLAWAIVAQIQYGFDVSLRQPPTSGESS